MNFFMPSEISDALALASSTSFPTVDKYNLILGSVPEGRTMARHPSSNRYSNTLDFGKSITETEPSAATDWESL